jgi:hypothetical protein
MLLLDFIVYMYRFEDIIVIFMKLYLITINRVTISCIGDVFYGDELNRFAYETVFPFYLRIAFCKADGIIVFFLLIKIKKRHIHRFEKSCLPNLMFPALSFIHYLFH